jgi:hypothetical protein
MLFTKFRACEAFDRLCAFLFPDFWDWILVAEMLSEFESICVNVKLGTRGEQFS